MNRIFMGKGREKGAATLLLIAFAMVTPLTKIFAGNDEDADFTGNYDPNDVAQMYICRYSSPTPQGPAMINGRPNNNWSAAHAQNRENFEVHSFTYKYPDSGSPAGFVDPYCENFVFGMLESLGRPDEIDARCRMNKRKLADAKRGNSRGGAGGSITRFTAPTGARSKGSRATGSSDSSYDVARAFAYHQEQRNSQDRQGLAESLIGYCEDRGINMNVRFGDYSSPYGRGAENCFNNGGTTIIKRQPSPLETILSAGLGFAKMYFPLQTMEKMHASHQDNVRHQQDIWADQGVIVGGIGAGSMGGYGIGGAYGGGMNYGCMGGGFGYGGCSQYGQGYGQGCVFGVGGCGGGANYPGLQFGASLGGYSGYGGSCPVGACYGNGGIVVGGSPYGGGGGACGTPPYAPWYAGCGAGGGNAFYANPYNSGFGLGVNGGLQDPYNRYPAGGWNSGVPGFNGGFNGGMNGGFNGAYINSGNMGQFPGSSSGFPGPWGTANGGNGWGNSGQWGANGQFGSPAFWGTNGSSMGSMGFNGNGVNNMQGYSSQFQQMQANTQRQVGEADAYKQYAQRKEQELRDAANDYGYAYGAAANSAQSVQALGAGQNPFYPPQMSPGPLMYPQQNGISANVQWGI